MIKLIIYKNNSFQSSKNLMKLKCKDRLCNSSNNNNSTQINEEGIFEIIIFYFKNIKKYKIIKYFCIYLRILRYRILENQRKLKIN